MERREELVFSVEPQNPVPAPFLTKTYQLVDDPLTDHIVSWGENETSFVVWRITDFAKNLLPNYFKHNNFSSFGFKKVVADRWEFANENFRKGAKHLLSEIHRRKTHRNHHDQQHPQQLFLKPEDSYGWMESPSPSPRGSSTDILTALTQDNQRLRRKNYMLDPTSYNWVLQIHVSGTETAETSVLGNSSSLTVPNNSNVKLFGVPLIDNERDFELAGTYSWGSACIENSVVLHFQRALMFSVTPIDCHFFHHERLYPLASRWNNRKDHTGIPSDLASIRLQLDRLEYDKMLEIDNGVNVALFTQEMKTC
ncbi:hypothetical protein GOBAR_DD11440 [Gossypium barbadense]|nr:hypothetical protein GOBAR_DD11440 [Gossypium barbadense]